MVRDESHSASTFEVDKKGLAKLLERRGKEFVLGELFQNAVDEDVTRVTMKLTAPEGGLSEVSVEDDNPSGFKNLTHAYTLFAESEKKDDPTKRGRFNLGEKLVIALCREAEISTTKGRIRFDDTGRMEYPPTRKRGSVFSGVLPMSHDEYLAACEFVRTLIAPANVKATFNGKPLPKREPLRVFDATLRTERADDEGILRPTTRKTTVAVYATMPGEQAHLYELGIPVVATGDKWHVDIGQKVPLNTDRDNVPPGYLRDVRTFVLNHTHDLLDAESAAAAWVTNALEDEAVEAEAVKAVVTERYGDKAVIADPTDREGTKIAVTQGYTVVPGGALSKAAWANVKAADALKPAGLVTPSPNPHAGENEVTLMDVDTAPAAVKEVVEFARHLGRVLLDADVNVRLANDVSWPYAATYGPRANGKQGQLTFNVGRLGFRWFEKGPLAEPVLSLIVHEFAHHTVSDHLSHEYHDACCDLGARLALAALDGKLAPAGVEA